MPEPTPAAGGGPVDAGLGRQVRSLLGPLGPFIALDVHVAGEQPTEPWAPLSVLIDQPARLDARVRLVGQALGAGVGPVGAVVETRVAASVTHLGVVARVIGPQLAARAHGLPGFALGGDEVWWQDLVGGPVPLSGRVVDKPRALLHGCIVEDLTELIAARYQLSSRVVWGNVASAANGVAATISRARPELTERVRQAAAEVLADPRVEDGALRAGPGFRRRSCCLIYRVAGDRGAVCGDCVLATDESS